MCRRVGHLEGLTCRFSCVGDSQDVSRVWVLCMPVALVSCACPPPLTVPCPQILAAASSVVSGVDMGYPGSNGLEPQQFVSNNQPCGYICYGFGEFDGQGSGHDFSGNVRARSPLGLRVHPCVMSLRAVSQRTGVCKGVELTRSCVCVYRTGTRPSASSTTATAPARTPTATTASSKLV